jgi:hypothetical protein
VYSSVQSATNERKIKRFHLFQDLLEDGMDSAYAAALKIRDSGAI